MIKEQVTEQKQLIWTIPKQDLFRAVRNIIMVKKIWQVWTENDVESKKQGLIVDEKILFTGTEQECKKYAKNISNVHIGYDLNEEN